MARKPGKPKGKPRGKPTLANLKPWKPGQSGNPGGRPKYGEVSKAIRAILELEDLDSYTPQTVAEKLALVRVKQALLKGGLFEAQFVTDRAEGKPLSTVHSNMNLTGVETIIDILTPPDGTSGAIGSET